MAVWAIGKIGHNPSISMDKIINLMNDSYWKVKTSACVAIGLLGPDAITKSMPALVEHLKTGSINRVIVAETIIKLGEDGERMLIEILKKARVNDAKLILPIVQSLELANITHNTIDFVIEELLKFAKADHIPIKKSALETLYKIQERSEEQKIIALDPKAIIPFLYTCLSSNNIEIREIAREFMTIYGAKAELALIEGFTKDENV